MNLSWSCNQIREANLEVVITSLVSVVFICYCHKEYDRRYASIIIRKRFCSAFQFRILHFGHLVCSMLPLHRRHSLHICQSGCYTYTYITVPEMTFLYLKCTDQLEGCTSLQQLPKLSRSFSVRFHSSK